MKSPQRKHIYPNAGIFRHDTPSNTAPHYLAFAALLVFITPITCLISLILGLGIGTIVIFSLLSSFILYFIFQDIQLKSKKLATVIVIGLPLLVVALGYYFWNAGTPYGEREYNETGEYYIQRYSTIGPSTFKIAMPGQGSDSIDGFIKLYDAKGTLLNEYFTTYLVGIEPTWLHNSLWLMGTSPEISWLLH